MRSNAARVAMGIVAIAAAVVLLIILKDGGGDSSEGQTTSAKEQAQGSGATSKSVPKEPATPTIVIRNGKPVGGVQDLTFNAGEPIRFTVRSDAADEVHVHGYDVSEEAPAGGVATLSFPAEIEGLFEVELHPSDEQIAELRVNP
jgi:hypothetical protein